MSEHDGTNMANLQSPARTQAVIEFDPVQQACSWRVGEGFPIINLIHALDLLRAMLINSQLADMARQNERKVVVPSLNIVPPKGN